MGGSPCNDFSRANPRREGFTGKWGKLFFDYARILAICRAKHEEANLDSPFYWLFENVIMDVEDKVGGRGASGIYGAHYRRYLPFFRLYFLYNLLLRARA